MSGGETGAASRARRDDVRPTLVVLAAGMGSRFGGPKQLEPVGPHGETIMEYGIFDALRAGFGDAVVITREELEPRIRAVLDTRIGARVPIRYVHQRLDQLPAGFTVPPERTKPWGTGQAVLCTESAVSRPFAVVNADDFYGAGSYRLVREFFEGRGTRDEGRATASGGTTRRESVATSAAILSSLVPRPSSPPLPASAPLPSYCVVGFPLGETLSSEGGVNRARLDTDAEGWLVRTEEIKGIERNGADAMYRDAAGREHPLGLDQQVSMNMWGFTPAFFPQLRDAFAHFLEASGDDAKAEFLLPTVVQQLIARGEARVRVLPGGGPWCGVTYPQDKPKVAAEIGELARRGEYPTPLWP